MSISQEKPLSKGLFNNLSTKYSDGKKQQLVTKIKSGIEVSIVRRDLGKDTSVHTEGIQLEIGIRENVVKLIQYPSIALNGAHIAFHIPLTQVRASYERPSTTGNKWQLTLELSSSLKPKSLGGIGTKTQRSIQEINAKMWCTLPFEPLPAKSVVHIAVESGETVEDETNKFIQSLQDIIDASVQTKQMSNRENRRISERLSDATDQTSVVITKASHLTDEVHQVSQSLTTVPQNAGTLETIFAAPIPQTSSHVVGRTFTDRVNQTSYHPSTKHNNREGRGPYRGLMRGGRGSFSRSTYAHGHRGHERFRSHDGVFRSFPNLSRANARSYNTTDASSSPARIGGQHEWQNFAEKEPIATADQHTEPVIDAKAVEEQTKYAREFWAEKESQTIHKRGYEVGGTYRKETRTTPRNGSTRSTPMSARTVSSHYAPSTASKSRQTRITHRSAHGTDTTDSIGLSSTSLNAQLEGLIVDDDSQASDVETQFMIEAHNRRMMEN